MVVESKFILPFVAQKQTGGGGGEGQDFYINFNFNELKINLILNPIY